MKPPVEGICKQARPEKKVAAVFLYKEQSRGAGGVEEDGAAEGQDQLLALGPSEPLRRVNTPLPACSKSRLRRAPHSSAVPASTKPRKIPVTRGT